MLILWNFRIVFKNVKDQDNSDSDYSVPDLKINQNNANKKSRNNFK